MVGLNNRMYVMVDLMSLGTPHVPSLSDPAETSPRVLTVSPPGTIHASSNHPPVSPPPREIPLPRAPRCAHSHARVAHAATSSPSSSHSAERTSPRDPSAPPSGEAKHERRRLLSLHVVPTPPPSSLLLSHSRRRRAHRTDEPS